MNMTRYYVQFEDEDLKMAIDIGGFNFIEEAIAEVESMGEHLKGIRYHILGANFKPLMTFKVGHSQHE